MAQTTLGRIKQFCKKNNLDETFYHEQKGKGLKWCVGCKGWHKLETFGQDSSRFDGLAAMCKEARINVYKNTYKPKIRISKKGTRFVIPRDGDKKQARHRINHLINIGLLPFPNNLPCTDCGHLYKEGERRHEYDHHKGYSGDSQEEVEVVCTTCHHKRERERNGTN